MDLHLAEYRGILAEAQEVAESLSRKLKTFVRSDLDLLANGPSIVPADPPSVRRAAAMKRVADAAGLRKEIDKLAGRFTSLLKRAASARSMLSRRKGE